MTAGKDRFDRVIGHPPVELAWGKTTQYAEEPLIEEMLSALTPGGRAVVIVSSGYLYRDRPDPAVRRRLVADDWLRAVIQLPGSTRDQAGPPAILVLDQQPKDDTIVFLDLSQAPQDIWLQQELAFGLLDGPQGFLTDRWPQAGSDDALQPKWRCVPRREITAEADLNPARYLKHADVLANNEFDLMEAQENHEMALIEYQRALKTFSEAAKDFLSQ